LLGQALSKLSSYDSKALRKPLTPEEEAWIDRSWDIMNLQEEEKTGGIGSSVPVPGSTVGGSGAAGIPSKAEAGLAGPTAQVGPPAVASSVASTQETIPAEVQAYMLKHPELSLDFVMKKYQEYMRLKGVE
jgi:hypothetical protein